MIGKHFKEYKLPNYSKFIIDFRNDLKLTDLSDKQKNYLTFYIFGKALIESGLYTNFEIETIIKNEMDKLK